MTRTLQLELASLAGTERRAIPIGELVIAGWTGRDQAALEAHIAELAALGVKPPSTTPIFYRVSAARLTTEDEIEVPGTASSGEAEFVLLRSGGALWVGAGSDHTEREIERMSVTVSKQMCDKPVAPVFWKFDEVAPHWGSLILRSHIVENGASVLYQEGGVASMRTPSDLIARYAPGGLAEGTMMFCGTLGAIGGVRPAEAFRFELVDPVLGRTIEHAYRTVALPIRE